MLLPVGAALFLAARPDRLSNRLRRPPFTEPPLTSL